MDQDKSIKAAITSGPRLTHAAGESATGKILDVQERFERIRRTGGLLLAPIVFLAVYLLPLRSFSIEAHKLAAIFSSVIVLWITEGLPLPVTALLGPCLAVIFGVASPQDVFAAFADPLIFLFIGSFILANAIFVYNLDKWVAYSFLSAKWVGSSPSKILLALGATCFLISMWVTNTATAAMMFPIAMSILSFLSKHQEFDPRYGTGLMLMTAYATSLGGMVTPVGTAPNLIAVGMIGQFLNYHISFLQWMIFAFPIAAVLFLILFLYLNGVCPAGVSDIRGSLAFLSQERDKLGRLSRGQKNA